MRISIWSFVTAGLIFMLFGPVMLVAYIIGWLFVWYKTTKKGLLFLQSYAYIVHRHLKPEKHTSSANWVANQLTPSQAKNLEEDAIQFTKDHANNMQDVVIQQAKQAGFIYTGKSFFDLFK